MFAAHFVVEKAAQQFLNGEINALDFCDLVEEVIDDMDGYLEEVNSNLERMLQGESFLELMSI
ncbi:MAG: hypothetical protein F6K48_21825 [Okeania sp. SIO3H1]|nr:hypothetical protein [Okeania sp. SIO3H1]